MKRKYRVSNPLRFFIFILLLVLGVSMLLYTILGLAESGEGSVNRKSYRQIEVRDGETIWSIAESYGAADGDTRSIVREIRETNDLSSDDIQPGDALFVPV